MIKTHLSLFDENGIAIEIARSDVRGIQAILEINTFGNARQQFAGSLNEYIQVKTSGRQFKIPRRAENDAELLSFILTHRADREWAPI